MKFSDLKLRVRALFMPGKVDRELADELAFRIACEPRKLMAAGLGAAQARQRALARFGPVPLAPTSAGTNAGSPSSSPARGAARIDPIATLRARIS